jgi:uncharacterized protein YndB with AHSA1/START domain
MNVRTVQMAPVKKAIRIAVPQAHAFEVFTARFGNWWPRTHHIGGADMQDVVIEPRLNGRWYEKGVDGGECDWGKVLVWEPPSRLVLSWHFNSQFKIDPGVKSEIDVRFIAEGKDATRVELEHRLEAADAEAIRASVDSPRGWDMLLGLYAEAAASGSGHARRTP